MVNVIRGDINNKPVSSKRLADYFERRDDIDGNLYLGYPIIGTSQGGYQIDALLVSRQHGVIIFNIIEGSQLSIETDEAAQDESFTKVQAKLLGNPNLLKKRTLMVHIGVLTFAPALTNKPKNIAED
ncbi:MAG: hypothetical protein ACKPKG_14700, partial [Dolichospermum sp.]